MNKLLIASVLLAASCVLASDVGKGMVELVIERGYPIEEYSVETADGYILGVFRIPYGKAGPSPNRTAVFLQHGLMDSSYTWVNNFAYESLAYILADAGYDVWLGNNRGNMFSQKHVSLSVDSDEFWDFSYDQMAQYDMPAQVDFVLQQTGQANISFIGHSEGTTQAFAAFAMDSTDSMQVRAASGISKKINLLVALAPIGTIQHEKSPLVQFLAGLTEVIDITKILTTFGVRDFAPPNSLLQTLAPWLCKTTPTGCMDVLFLACGYTDNVNASRMDVYMSETPAGTSVRNMGHWAQNALVKQFQMFDYGCASGSDCQNMNVYGQPTAPVYDVSKISVPMAFISGGHDDLGDPTDVAWLIGAVPKESVAYAYQEPQYDHMDFVWADNAYKLIYNRITPLLTKYNA